MKKISLCIALAFSSTSSYAIESGTFLNWNDSYTDMATFNCTGTLIGGNQLITAAHCELQKDSVLLSDGRFLMATPHNNPAGVSDPNGPDISIWSLTETVQTEDIRFIANLNTDPVSDNDLVTILGFGGGTTLNSAQTRIDMSGTTNASKYHSSSIGNGVTQGGDSGGPWLNQDNNIVAIHNSGANDSMFATSLFFVKDWLLEQINGWHYPTLKTGNGNISIKVQSLHQGGVADSAYTTGDITLTGGSCVGHTLSAFETCTYDVSAPNSASGTLHLSATETIKVNPAATQSTNAASGSGGNGGGGSLGGLALLVLGALGYKRRRTS